MTIEERTTLEQEALKSYPGFVRADLCENGDLYLYSLGAYPAIIKNWRPDYEDRE